MNPTAPLAPTVSGSTLLFPVIGHPARQVRAPSVFNGLFGAAGLDALCFGLDLGPHTVIDTCRALLESPSVGGLLVTVPYKRVLADAADRLGAASSQVGAVNALRRAADGRVEGDLFDGLGFVRGVRAAGHGIAGRRVLLLGAGGAGSAIAAALANENAAEVAIFDPKQDLGAALVNRLQPHFAATALRAQERPAPSGYDIVVNASPLGLAQDDPLPADPAQFEAGTLVCDIIMKPPTTRFLQQAASCGLAIHRGRHMLDHQIPAYLSFFGLPDVAARVRVTQDAVSLTGS